VQDAVDPQLAALAGVGAGEHRNPRGDEDLVVHGGAVQVGVRPDQYGVAHHERVVGTTSEQRMFHHDDGRSRSPPVAVRTAPASTRDPAPIVTSPVTTAAGAIQVSE
jgi:hypothetical protein